MADSAYAHLEVRAAHFGLSCTTERLTDVDLAKDQQGKAGNE